MCKDLSQQGHTCTHTTTTKQKQTREESTKASKHGQQNSKGKKLKQQTRETDIRERHHGRHRRITLVTQPSGSNEGYKESVATGTMMTTLWTSVVGLIHGMYRCRTIR
jgi:hypothetical protein